MYLTAQRIELSTGEDGINAFHYAHGTAYEIRERGKFKQNGECGICIATSYTVKSSGGNRVRSYIEVFTHDETPQKEILSAIISILASVKKFPHEGQSRRCFVRVALDQGIIDRNTWVVEVEHLVQAILKVRLPIDEAERLFQQYDKPTEKR